MVDSSELEPTKAKEVSPDDRYPNRPIPWPEIGAPCQYNGSHAVIRDVIGEAGRAHLETDSGIIENVPYSEKPQEGHWSY